MAKKIYLSPSSQPDNTYTGVNTNEQEVCRAIARELTEDLKRCGFEVICGDYGTMKERAAESDKWGADLHVPIHTNAFNGKVSGTRLMANNLTGTGYKVCQAIFKYLAPLTPGTSENITANPGLYEIYAVYAPTAYIEVDFHDVSSVAQWLVNNKPQIAEAICKGICEYYGVKYVTDSTPTPAPTPTPVSTGNVSGLSSLYNGKSGNEVKIVQNLLIGKGYSCGSSGADGVFGTGTANAVKKFQTDKKLTADGVVGPATWKALLNVK